MDNAGPVSATPTQVANLVSSGVVKTDEIIRLLVATGTWSDSGAAEIVSTIAQQPDDTNPPPNGLTFSGRGRTTTLHPFSPTDP